MHLWWRTYPWSLYANLQFNDWLIFSCHCHRFGGPWWNSFHDSFPSRQLKLEEQFLHALSHMGYGIWCIEASVTFPTHSCTRAGICQPWFMCPSPTYGLGLNAYRGLNPGFQTHQAGRKHWVQGLKWHRDHLNQTSASPDRRWKDDVSCFLTQCLGRTLIPSVFLFFWKHSRNFLSWETWSISHAPNKISSPPTST